MNWLKYKKYYFLISLILIAISLYSLLVFGLKLGVEFKGGSILEYKFSQEISTEEATERIEKEGIEVTSIQTTGENTYLIKFPPIEETQKASIASIAAQLVSKDDGNSKIDELRFENVGPAVGPELVKKTIYASLIAASLILIWVAYQFKSFKFGMSAILAMLHDSLILIGLYALFGKLFGAEVDFLFVTAVLTTLSFSVHDTIVVFDRIREIQKTEKEDLIKTANQALTETMVRSLNNSFTIIFMLVALLLLGGTTIKWFATALLIGTILGTYSSPFVAVPLLVSWDTVLEKLRGLTRK